MTTPYSGLPANIVGSLPNAANISSTTHATPIVVTTAAPHGLHTGDFLYIDSAADPAADGYGRVGTITSTTFVLLHQDGTNTVGTAAGGAFGTVSSLAFGTRLPLREDMVDDDNAAGTNVPDEELADRTAYLLALSYELAPTITKYQTSIAGDTITLAGGATWVDSPAYLDIVGCKTNDMIQVWAQTTITTGPGYSVALSAYEDRAGVNSLSSFGFVYPTSNGLALTLLGALSITYPGTARVMMQGKGTNLASLTYSAGNLLVVRSRRGF